MPLPRRKIPTSQPGPVRSKIKTFPPPMMGMNATAAALAGNPAEALLLENWYFDQYGMSVRPGWATFVENIAHTVRTLIPAHAKNVAPNFDDPFLSPGPGKLFAATDVGIYDVTADTGTPANVFALSGATYAGQISFVSFSTQGGLFIVACSQTDGYLLYTESSNTWVKVLQDTTTTTPAPPTAGEIRGANPANFVFVCMFKKRLCFVERDTGNMWYLPVEQLAGDVLLFQFGPLLTHGGVLAEIGVWTHDAGIGIDDHLYALGFMGDVLIYKGIDPSDANDFNLVGSWYVGAIPAGRRASGSYAGEVVIVSEMGLTSISTLMGGTADMERLRNKIRPMLAKHVFDWGGEYGWGMVVFPRAAYVLLNGPPGNESARQYAMGLNFNAWSVFTAMPAYCWAVFNGNLYFGTADGRVCVAFYGDLDDMERDLTGGTAVVSKMIGTFQAYDTPAITKQWQMVRPVIEARLKPQARLWINTDFNITTGGRGAPAFRPITISRWDQDKWDIGRWSGKRTPYNDWFSVEGLGRIGAIGFVMSSLGNERLYQLDAMYEETNRVF